MRTLFLTGLMAAVLVQPALAQDAAAPAKTFPLKQETLDLQDGDSIVFLGDSITHQRLYTQYVEDYFYTRFPNLRLKLHNAGVGGARAWDALQRFDQDVAAYKPKYVSILLGMNDGTYKPYDDPTFQTYRRDMNQLVEKIAALGAKPILMSPTMYDSRAKRMHGKPGTPEENIQLYNSVLSYYGTWLREVAGDKGYGFVDMWGPLNNLTLEGREKDPQFTLIRDAVHPDAPGQVVMAVAMIDDLELPKTVSRIRIHVKQPGKGKAAAEGDAASNAIGASSAENGALENVSFKDGALSFDFTAKSLPWVLPAEAQLGVELTQLGHRFGRESLRVTGLPPGKYTLTIDGTEVGKYDANHLSAGVALESNSKTPQYQQALQVAELNKKRNEGPVKALRDDWLKFQAFSRLKRELTGRPNDPELMQKVEAAGKAATEAAERVAKHNEEAKAIEDEIFKVNQPVKRAYSLQKAK